MALKALKDQWRALMKGIKKPKPEVLKIPERSVYWDIVDVEPRRVVCETEEGEMTFDMPRVMISAVALPGFNKVACSPRLPENPQFSKRVRIIVVSE